MSDRTSTPLLQMRGICKQFPSPHCSGDDFHSCLFLFESRHFMKIPKRIQPLVEEGLVDAVIRQLMSGKEATVYVVRCGEEIRCAKVYKEASQRSFRQAASYQEGRKVRNSRQARAMEKGSRYGRHGRTAMVATSARRFALSQGRPGRA